MSDKRTLTANPDQMPRLALYLSSLRGGGAERVMVTLANAFDERGCAVDLVLATAEGPYLDEVSDAVRLMDLGCSSVFTSLPRLAGYLRRERPKAMTSAMGHANTIALLPMFARVSRRVYQRLLSWESDNMREPPLAIKALNSFAYSSRKYVKLTHFLVLVLAVAYGAILSQIPSEQFRDGVLTRFGHLRKMLVS